ncbi:MAG: hypothetical protein CMJ12_05415 [Pelagibacterales bacterium]|nr:hypothetical protein [Pelagibacterales bacterium]PPR15525.1 MAG: hypothetical protein CFH33_01385 [Alphaproteobacteria bacterium MarineAlpha9_Bin3]|tara:strand:+ start:4137 stop:5084 length:948 start_codon:yes stop_codon:yes gene_type:complete
MKLIFISLFHIFIFNIFSVASANETKQVNIWSDGTRMSGDIHYPTSYKNNDKFPAILMTQGWGGTRNDLNKYFVPIFVNAGFIVLTFDYRGWEDSDSRLVIIDKQPTLDENNEAFIRVKAIREVIDPIDQTRDIISALDFLSGEPKVDKSKIGIWGTSYSGGHVIYVAGIDKRVSAIYSQVSFQGIGLNNTFNLSRKRAIQKARGQIDPIPTGIDKVPNLKGSPDFAKMLNYKPLDWAKNIKVPTLIVDVESEELFDRKKNGLAAFDVIKDNTIAKYKLYSGSHYDIYYKHFNASTKLALEWFTEHLINSKNISK